MEEDWTKREVEIIISDYFDMLQKELNGISYIKSQHNKRLITLLNNRTKGSIEFKHQNISAVLLKLQCPIINGYKRKDNYQTLLEEEVIKFIKKNISTLEKTFQKFTEKVPDNTLLLDYSKCLASPPKTGVFNEPEIPEYKKPIKINYLEREQSNTILGENGEKLVLEYEKWRLIVSGKDKWVDQIEWISQKDDSAGFDILSKNPNGTDRYIEVKTTKLRKEAPIFFSKNELEFSNKKSDNFHLYRVFNFAQNPKIFCLNGSFDSFCKKEALSFKGYF